MSKEKKNTMVPKLRFPEFREAEGWNDCTIDSIGEVVTGGTPSKEEKEYWGGDFVWVTAQDFKDKYIIDSVLKLSEKGKEKSRIIPKNSVLVTCIASIGLNGINKVECATNQQINSIICNSESHYEFVYYSINQNGNRLKNLAGQTAVPIINKSVFEKFVIQKPNSSEQQKIAACLTTLDELISAQSEQLTALQAHKKGLMQQLFPAEGERVPRVRFGEFEGEWEEKALSEILIEGRLGGNYENYENISGIPVIKMGNLDRGIINLSKIQYLPENESYNDDDVLKRGDLLLNTRNTLELVGKVAIWKDELPFAVYNSNLLRLKFDEEYVATTYFMNYLFNTPFLLHRLKKIATGTTSVAAIYTKDLNRIELQIPSLSEQQKIAACLTSLDELITAQSQKIEALQAHKKGLMQGLFPNPEAYVY